MIKIKFKKTFQSSENQMILDIDMHIQKGQFVTLFGESGAGKTTILRAISGLLEPDNGQIKVGPNYWYNSDKKTFLSPQKRKIGFLFQDYALFPNMTVHQNLTFALHANQNEKIIDELVDTMELHEFMNRKPETLSGGQKQRVALARALVSQPEILLLDEPLSALDNKMRLKLQEYLAVIHKKYNLTTIMVSHDISEIVKLSDFVYEIKKGEIHKLARPSDFFSHSNSSAKFKFTGEIVEIIKEDVIYVVSVLIGNNVVKIVSDINEVNNLLIGDKVFVASKAFNPIIQKI